MKSISSDDGAAAPSAEDLIQFAEVQALVARYGLTGVHRSERLVFDRVIADAAAGRPTRVRDLLRSQPLGRSTVYRHIRSLVSRRLVTLGSLGPDSVLVPSDRVLAFSKELEELLRR